MDQIIILKIGWFGRGWSSNGKETETYFFTLIVEWLSNFHLHKICTHNCVHKIKLEIHDERITKQKEFLQYSGFSFLTQNLRIFDLEIKA